MTLHCGQPDELMDFERLTDKSAAGATHLPKNYGSHKWSEYPLTQSFAIIFLPDNDTREPGKKIQDISHQLTSRVQKVKSSYLTIFQNNTIPNI